MSRGGAVVRVVRTSGLGVLRQLKLEEALLRADASNWCIVNDGVDSPAAVLGLSGLVFQRTATHNSSALTPSRFSAGRKPDIMLDLPLVKASGLAVVRRFSGGGTVVVDRDTLMVSFIFGAEAAPHVPCFPAPLMLWSEQFYSGVFHDTAGFRLRENGESDDSCVSHRSTCKLTPHLSSSTRRLRVWRAQVRRQCTVHHKDEMGAPYLIPLGLPASADGMLAASPTGTGVPPGAQVSYRRCRKEAAIHSHCWGFRDVCTTTSFASSEKGGRGALCWVNASR